MYKYLRGKTELEHGNTRTSQSILFYRAAAAADPDPPLIASSRVMKHVRGQPKLIANSS